MTRFTVDGRNRLVFYGNMVGYVSIEKLLDLLRAKGVVQIPFSYAYDSRQYSKRMDRCFMEIWYVGSGKRVKRNNRL